MRNMVWAAEREFSWPVYLRTEHDDIAAVCLFFFVFHDVKCRTDTIGCEDTASMHVNLPGKDTLPSMKPVVLSFKSGVPAERFEGDSRTPP